MLELHPFTGHLVAAERAHRVVAPPYDALDPTARATLAATDPDSYLGALPPGTAADTDQLETVLTRCRSHLDRLLATGRYRALPGPAIAVLAFGAGTGRAVAVVGDVPTTAFASLAAEADAPSPGRPGSVLPHEQVDERRVHQLARYLDVVGVASSPVALSQRPSSSVTAATASVMATAPDLAYRADDGVDVALWAVTDPMRCRALTAAVADAGPAFLADGHHRGAAAVRHAAHVGAGPDEPASRVLCAVLPSDHLTVHPFHRRLDDVLPTDEDPGDRRAAAEAALDRVREALIAAGVTVTDVPAGTTPTRPHHVVLTAAGNWWALDVSALVRSGDLVEALDVRLVERDLLPLLRTATGRHGTVVPVAAPLGTTALVAPGAVGLALHPPDIGTVLAVAAAGRTLPPKTTYVTPKLRSGLVVTPRGRSATPGTAYP